MGYTKEQIEIIKKELTPVDCESLYDDMLNDCFGAVKIGGYEYDHADAQKSVDPTAYRCGVNDYIDSLVGESITDEIDGEHYNLSEIEDLIELMRYVIVDTFSNVLQHDGTFNFSAYGANQGSPMEFETFDDAAEYIDQITEDREELRDEYTILIKE